MNKKIFSTIVAVILTICSIAAQKTTTISVATFKNLIGCWDGSLNYSGTIIRKPFSTSAEVVIKQIPNCNKFRLLHIYTKDPNDNVADTITISKDGKKLNNDPVKSKRSSGAGEVEIITEAAGFDHDNNKAAIIRQIYTIGKNVYSYRKQVQLQGQTDWLDRQEFKYVRKACPVKSEKS